MKNEIKNQIIVRDNGHSWLGCWMNVEKMNESLNSILEVSKKPQQGEYKNRFWVLDFSGSVVAAQPSLSGAMRYYNDNRILVHFEPVFVNYYSLKIMMYDDGSTHEVQKYIKNNEGEISIWTNTRQGRHVVGQTCSLI